MGREIPENIDKNINTDVDHTDYRKLVEERVKKEAEALAAANKNKVGLDQGGGDGKITSRFVQDCLYTNELGDGMLYAAIHSDRFLYNKSAGGWMVWADHHWEDDIMTKSQAMVEDVALRYLEEAHEIVNYISEASKSGEKDKIAELQDRQKSIYKRAGRLRSDRGRTNCLKFAHTNPANALAIKGDELDINPMLFACKNGVIDLRTGELRPGRQDDLISKASPVEFTGVTTPAPNCEKALGEIFGGNNSMINYLGRLFGYGMTGLTVERFMPIFYGGGNNGKTTIVEIISYIMGSLASPIEAEMLLDQGHAKSSGAASPEIMAMRGLRLAFASETDQGRRFSTSRVKWLIGSDTMIGRFLYEKQAVAFIPTHKLILLTNHKPDVSGDDDSFWEKIHLVPFPFSFVLRKPEKDYERPADKYLRQKLLTEASGILAWLVRGCMQWQEKGLAPPAVVIDASKEYRRDEDLIGHFINECCYESSDAETSAKNLYDCFKKWWEINVSRKALSQKRFGGMMVKKFKRSKSGTYRYFGIGIGDD
jgi:putative DNA primase/helicase